MFISVWEYATSVGTNWIAWVAAVPFFLEQGYPHLSEKRQAQIEKYLPKSSHKSIVRYLAIFGFVFASFQAFDHVNSELKEERNKTVSASPRWRPLSADEQRAMRDRLRSLPPLEMNVMCSVPTCYDLAESLKSAFDDLQWKGGLHTSYWSEGVSTGIELWSSDDSALPVASAIESASKGRLKVAYKRYPLPASEVRENNLVVGRLPK
jgi:hypothetical protein